MSDVIPGLVALSVGPEQPSRCCLALECPFLGGRFGRDALSKLAPLVMSPGREWRGGQMPRQLH